MHWSRLGIMYSDHHALVARDVLAFDPIGIMQGRSGSQRDQTSVALNVVVSGVRAQSF